MYVSIKTSPYICLHVFKIVLFMHEWTIERKERMKIFMYKIMRIHVYNNESVYESVYLFISIQNCA